jgi:hypothetical protein
MQHSRHVTQSFVGAILLLTAAPEVKAVDVTGIWKGRLVCQVSRQGPAVDQQMSRPVTLHISPAAPFITTKITLLDGEPVFSFGTVVGDKNDTTAGRLATTVCAGNPPSAMVATVSRVDPTTRQGELQGRLLFFTSDMVATCTVNCTRVSQQDPHVPPCF